MSAKFKAVVWKELRENLSWAVFVLLGMTTTLAVVIPSRSNLFRGQGVDFEGIPSLDRITMIGALLAGLLIGAVQTLIENRGDKWGFLAHRPISRTSLFWGKATAGILLYAMSTAVPVAMALCWIASPGYLPLPFDWKIALPAIANLLCGLVFYFAGFLTGMREARWYTSRALGIGAAFCCLALQLNLAVDFWQAAAISATGLIIVGTAAWGTFVAGGQYGVQPLVGRVATGISIGLGITLFGWFAYSTNIDSVEFHEIPEEAGNTSDTSYAVTSEGVVVKITKEDHQITEISDPGGRPLDQYRNLPSSQDLGAYVSSVRLYQEQSAPPSIRPRDSFRSSGRLFSQLRRTDAINPVGWYYVHRLGLIAAYDSQSRKLIGWMGPDGFSPGDTKPRPFAGRPIRTTYSPLLMFEGVAYRLNFENQSIKKVFQAERSETLLASASQYLNAASLEKFGEAAAFEVISTTRRVIVQRLDGTRLLEAPQDAKTRAYPVLEVSRALRAPGAPTFLWYRGQLWEGSHVSEFNSAGAVVNSWALPSTDRVRLKWDESLPRIVISSTVFPLLGLTSFEVDRRTPWVKPPLSRSAQTARWAAAILSMLISAAAVFLQGRSHAFPPGRLFAWTVIALALGPIGYLLMNALIEWPARESCPACSRKRVVTRERCEHCGEPFAAPPRDGTEIFEPMRDQHA